MEILPLILLGFALGLKHSLDVDHLAAVTAILPGRTGKWRAALVGAWWGVGHSLALLALGGAIIAFDVAFPPAASLALEFAVGGMLVFLGLRLLIRLRRGGVLHVHAHEHGGRRHLHPHLHERAKEPSHGHGHAGHQVVTPGRSRGAAGPIAVGGIHGLAGSAGLTLALLPAMPTKLAGILYLGVFGLGSILGMTLATWILSVPLAAFGPNGRLGRGVTAVAACLSVAVGAALMLTTGGDLLRGWIDRI